jgi:hypothetical protein
MTAHQIYDETIKPLPAAERLQLATLILNDIPPQSVTDYREDWTEAEKRSLTEASLRYAAECYAEGEELV